MKRSRSVELRGVGPVCLELPLDGSNSSSFLSHMNDEELKEWVYINCKDQIMERLHVIHVGMDNTEEETCSENSQTFSQSFSAPTTCAEAAPQALSVCRQRLELLEKVALVQKKYLLSKGPKVVFDGLLQGLLDLLVAEFGFIGEVRYDNNNDKYLHTHSATNIAWDETSRKFVEENESMCFYNLDTLFGRAILEEQPVIQNQRATGTPLGHPAVNSFMGIPFFSESNKVIGMMGVANKPGGFSKNDIDFLDPFTVTCSNLVQSYWQIEKNKDLIDTLERKVLERTEKLEAANVRLEQANRRVIKSSALQLQHFACMSHEIRTPLNCIIGLLSLLQETNMTASQKESMSMIVASSELLATVVNDVLDYSKLETGHVDIHMQKINLQETLNSVLHSIGMKAAAKGISLITDFDPSVPRLVHTDGQRLQQILFNLLGNAIKFSSANSEVELRIEVSNKGQNVQSGYTYTPDDEAWIADNNHSMSEEDAFLLSSMKTSQRMNGQPNLQNMEHTTVLRFVVKDYGNGIEPTEYDKIFKPFLQANAETERVYGGTGLGLAVTAKLVCGLSGTISVDSVVGEWSNFTVELPLFDDCPAQAQTLSTKFANVTTLVVSKSNRDKATMHLKRTFEAYGVNHFLYRSMEELEQDFCRQGFLEKDRKYACLCQEDLYESGSFELLCNLANAVLVTFGPNYSVSESEYHIRCPSQTLSSLLLHSIGCFMDRSFGQRPSMKRSSSGTSMKSLQDSNVSQHPNSCLRVLVAEDNIINQKVIARMLTRLGVIFYDIVENGLLAVDHEAKNEYDVVLMDMQMPIMGGLEACRAIMSREDGNRKPMVVFVTAHVSSSYEKECLQAGGSGFLPKPFNIHEIEVCFDSIRQRMEETESLHDNEHIW